MADWKYSRNLGCTVRVLICDSDNKGLRAIGPFSNIKTDEKLDSNATAYANAR